MEADITNGPTIITVISIIIIPIICNIRNLDSVGSSIPTANVADSFLLCNLITLK